MLTRVAAAILHQSIATFLFHNESYSAWLMLERQKEKQKHYEGTKLVQTGLAK
jgi:cell division protein FtsB